MSKALKALLLSALIFPGLGHLVINRPMRTIVFAGISMVCIFNVVAFISAISEKVLGEVESGVMPADPNLISERIHAEMAAGGDTASMMLVLFGVVWLIALVDAYRQGKKLDKELAEEHSQDQKSREPGSAE